VGLAAALGAYTLLGFAVAWRGPRATLKRALMALAFCIAAAGAGLYVKGAPRDGDAESRAWGPKKYAELFALHARTEAPADPAQRVRSTREPDRVVDDPEVYKLNAVYHAAGNVSTINNIWRLLLWRKMWSDTTGGAWLLGAGPGYKWTCAAMYDSPFDAGDPRLGMDPHNSYLHLFYRYGALGFALLLLVVGLVFRSAVAALRKAAGDPWLEGACCAFVFSATFAAFTVSLEGPSYSMPFWMSLATVYARASQLLRGDAS
jgi:hypothetical protein